MTKAVQKHPGGRPTKYNPQIVQKVDEYLASVGHEQAELPTIEGLAHYLDVDTDTISTWVEARDEHGNLTHPEFSVAIKKVKERQKTQLINDGMYGGKEVNAAMAIFLLKANHGMKDSSPQVLVQNNFHEHAKNELKEFEE